MLCFVMLIQFNGDIYAESKPPKTIRMIAEPNSQWFLDGKMKYGCEVVMDSGRKRRTRGYLSGDISWKKIRVSSDQAVSNSDKLTVDLEKVKANHNTLSLDIFWVGDENIHAHFDYKIPELKSIDLFLDDQIKIKPGKTFTPKALFTFENGLRYSCNPWDKKALVHSDQVVLFFGRDEVPDGRITIPENAATKSEQLNVSMVWKSNQNVYDLKVLPLEITPEESLDIEVLSGSTGRHGRLGSTNQDGWIGEVGGVGHDAPEVNVYMWMNDDSTYLIINTICLSEKKSFQLKPGADVMKINVQGGKGGRGGRGGTGGDGAPGTDDSGGFGGEGGQGGQGGKGGLVIIHCDPKAELHLNQLNINNAGGEGGEGGYGGKGGRRADYDGNVTLFEALFPDRNSRGYDGPQGDWGANGPEAEVNVLDKAEVQRLWNSIVP